MDRRRLVLANDDAPARALLALEVRGERLEPGSWRRRGAPRGRLAGPRPSAASARANASIRPAAQSKR